MPENIYFELTEAFNADRCGAILASGQAVVYYRVAILSKDGDWILRETEGACARVLALLAERGARYRPVGGLDRDELALPGGHGKLCELAERLLPTDVNVGGAGEPSDEDA